MVIKLSSILKTAAVLVALAALAAFAFRYVRLERRVSDLDFRVMVVNKQLAAAHVLEGLTVTPTATPSPVPTPKLKVK